MPAAIAQPIDQPFAGRILTLKTSIIGNLLAILRVFLAIIGFGTAGIAAYFLSDAHRDEPWLDPLLSGILLALGIAIGVGCAYWAVRNTTSLANWYLRRLARNEIKSRPDAIVDPDDPEALFVEIVPRENRQRMMLETATDIGFLLVDERRREVVFEGDRERMRIPASAIMTCKVDLTLIGGQPNGIKYFFTTIRAEHGPSFIELPFAHRGDMGRFGARIRQRRAEELRDRIWGMTPE